MHVLVLLLAGCFAELDTSTGHGPEMQAPITGDDGTDDGPDDGGAGVWGVGELPSFTGQGGGGGDGGDGGEADQVCDCSAELAEVRDLVDEQAARVDDLAELTAQICDVVAPLIGEAPAADLRDIAAECRKL